MKTTGKFLTTLTTLMAGMAAVALLIAVSTPTQANSYKARHLGTDFSLGAKDFGGDAPAQWKKDISYEHGFVLEKNTERGQTLEYLLAATSVKSSKSNSSDRFSTSGNESDADNSSPSNVNKGQAPTTDSINLNSSRSNIYRGQDPKTK